MKTNYEIDEVLKNIRTLKSQTDLLKELQPNHYKILHLALEDLSVSIFNFLKEDYQ